MRLLRKFKEICQKVWRSYYNNWLAEDNVDQEKVENLVWISKKLNNGTYNMMGNVDTIEMALDRMPIQEELVFEVTCVAQAKEILTRIQEGVVEECALQI